MGKNSIDRSTLEKLVEAAEAKDLTGYPTAKVEEFQKVLEEAKAVLDNEEATQDEIREAVENLQKASSIGRDPQSVCASGGRGL